MPHVSKPYLYLPHPLSHSLPITPSTYHTIYHTLYLSHPLPITPSTYHTLYLSHHLPITPSTYHTLSLSHPLRTTPSTYHTLYLSHHLPTTPSTYHTIYLPHPLPITHSTTPSPHHTLYLSNPLPITPSSTPSTYHTIYLSHPLPTTPSTYHTLYLPHPLPITPSTTPSTYHNIYLSHPLPITPSPYHTLFLPHPLPTTPSPYHTLYVPYPTSHPLPITPSTYHTLYVPYPTSHPLPITPSTYHVLYHILSLPHLLPITSSTYHTLTYHILYHDLYHTLYLSHPLPITSSTYHTLSLSHPLPIQYLYVYITLMASWPGVQVVCGRLEIITRRSQTGILLASLPFCRWWYESIDRRQWKVLMEGHILQRMIWKHWQKTTEGTDGGLHSAEDDRKALTEDNGRHWWRATFCRGWYESIDRRQWKALMEGYILQRMIGWQKTMEGIDGGPHSAGMVGKHWQKTMEGIDGGLHSAEDRQTKPNPANHVAAHKTVSADQFWGCTLSFAGTLTIRKSNKLYVAHSDTHTWHIRIHTRALQESEVTRHCVILTFFCIIFYVTKRRTVFPARTSILRENPTPDTNSLT